MESSNFSEHIDISLSVCSTVSRASIQAYSVYQFMPKRIICPLLKQIFMITNLSNPVLRRSSCTSNCYTVLTAYSVLLFDHFAITFENTNVHVRVCSNRSAAILILKSAALGWSHTWQLQSGWGHTKLFSKFSQLFSYFS